MKFIYLASFNLFFVCCNLYSQVEVAKNSRFFGTSPKENYFFYFQATTAEPDEYIEGHLVIYDINKNVHTKLSSETLILDFLDIQISNDSVLIYSNGSSVIEYILHSKERKQIYEAAKNQLINNFHLMEDKLLLSIKDTELDIHNVLAHGLRTKGNLEIYSQKDKSREELSKIEMLANTQAVYIKNITGDVFEYSWIKKDITKFDTNVLDILHVTNDNLYYSKESCIWEYNLLSKEKLDIVESDPLNVSYLSTYKNKLFIGLNDNILIYNKEEGSIKNVEELPKANYVFFSQSLAISQDNKQSIFILRNSN